MSRTIQVGDLALISAGDQQFPFPITSIDSSGIHASEYTIIPLDNQWQVQDYPIPHTVIFYQTSPSIPFTGVVELNWEILLDLDYQALARACQVNKEINKICQDDRFWRDKVRKDFGVEKYKPEEITYRQQYRDLIETNDPDPAAEEGRLDELIVLVARNIFPIQVTADLAASSGNQRVLEWLAERNILPTENSANAAAYSGHLQVLVWLAARNILPTQDGADWAARNGHLQVLEWLAARNILPTREGADLAARRGRFQVLERLVTKNILPTREAANYAAAHGQQEILEWLSAHGIYPIER